MNTFVKQWKVVRFFSLPFRPMLNPQQDLMPIDWQIDSVKSNGRGGVFIEVAPILDLNNINDGSTAFIKSITVRSCLEFTFVSKDLETPVTRKSVSEICWSDHIPTLKCMHNFSAPAWRRVSANADWYTLRRITDSAINPAKTNDELGSTTALCLKGNTNVLPWTPNRPGDAPDVEYERLRAIRCRAERKARHTE